MALRARLTLAVLLLAGLGACATVPADRAQRALYVDLRKAVELTEDTGWVVDRVELEGNAEDALRSACQAPRTTLDGLEAWLGAALAREGGDPATQHRCDGRPLSELDEALSLQRTLSVLRYARERSAADCPFWLEPEPEFDGVQGDAQRVIVLAETAGYGSLVIEGSNTAIGGGGSGRLLAGYGFSHVLTLALGAELGGNGMFVKNEEGKRGIETAFTAAFPVLLRMTRFSRVLDVEVAPVMSIDTSAEVGPPGLRTTLGVGLSAMRSSDFMPFGVLTLGYEIHPADDSSPADHSILVGTRVGLDWDP